MSQSTSVLRRNGFTFKQFFVAHDRCAMKVGTDGILLGAWAPVAGVKRCLDIGSGSGLLALMLAQRTDDSVMIDAVELESEAAAQAQENIAQSPWAERINIHTADIQQWITQQAARFDLIISNPPYYQQGLSVRRRNGNRRAIPLRWITRRCLLVRQNALPKRDFSAWCCRSRLVMVLLNWH